MPAKKGAVRQLADIRVTRNQQTFRRLIARYPKRLNVVAEGDSWFGYPSKSLLAGESNLVEVLVKKRRMNFLRLEANGDEAVEMLCGEQRKKLCSVLSRSPVDVLLFSGGGNDVVGRWDIEPLLKPKRPGMSALDCIDERRLARKIAQIRLAYEELIDCRDLYRPGCVILTHAYDYPIPQHEGTRVLGRVWAGPWLHPYLRAKSITRAADQRAIARSLIERLYGLLKEIEREQADGRFVLIRTPGTLRSRDWRDEIHPTREGFRRIAEMFWRPMRRIADAKTRAA